MLSKIVVLMFVFVGRHTILYTTIIIIIIIIIIFLTTTYDDDKIPFAVAPGAAFTVRIQSGVLHIYIYI